jgi:RNA polymerase sigma factor (TIGR02999 family)
MASAERDDPTGLLAAWSDGDASSLERLMPIVYDELRRMAARYLHRERGDHTLQATALVHEAFLKLIDQRQVRWQNRAHFFGIAAQLMRRILVDHARIHLSDKRGGSVTRVSLDEAIVAANQKDVDVVALDEALGRLAAFDPDQGRLVELRFFGGLTIDEAAEVLGTSPATVKREWALAKAWLHRALRAEARA